MLRNKLSVHICRIYLKNPEYENLYLKNWMVSNSYSIVFCKQTRKEVSILHSEACLDFTNSCQDLHGWYCKGDGPLSGPLWNILFKAEHLYQKWGSTLE